MKNKEIEELLNKIRNSIKTHKKLNLDDDMLVVLEFDVIQWNLLLSRIEQLEKEIERQSKLQVIQDDEITEANDSITWWQNRYNAIVNQNDDNHKKVVKLENNRDKAIEYIANIICDEKARVRHDLCGKDIDGLINILKGGSDE